MSSQPDLERAMTFAVNLVPKCETCADKTQPYSALQVALAEFEEFGAKYPERMKQPSITRGR